MTARQPKKVFYHVLMLYARRYWTVPELEHNHLSLLHLNALNDIHIQTTALSVSIKQ